MNYLISGLAKSGTTILFSRLKQAITPEPTTFFEPDSDQQLGDILASGTTGHTLSKVLIGRVTAKNDLLRRFDRHVVIHRDPRDQFISMLLYLFYDFQVKNDKDGYETASAALLRKVQAPEKHSTIELYNLVAGLVGRAPIAVFNNLHREQRAYIQAFSPHVLRYEDFIDNRLEAVEKYLALDLGDKAQVPEAYRRVARSKSYGDWKNWLNAQDLDYINSAWGDAIQSLGYSLHDKQEQLIIPVSSSIDYVSQFDPSPQSTHSGPGPH